MKAIIGTAVGILGLGGLVVAGSTRPAASPALLGDRTAVASGQTIVDCGEGRQAFVQPQASGISRVECVAMAPVQTVGLQTAGMPYAQFASQYQAVPAAPVQALPTIVQERVVYRDRPAARTTTARRASATPAARTVSAPVYRDEPQQTRSWKKSALIIGGATAGGAGVGAILDGKSGAKKGAVVGLVGGTVYDIATRNK